MTTAPSTTPGIDAYIARGQEMLAALAARRAVMRQKKFDTIAVHGVYDMQAALESKGSIIEPLILSSSQFFENSNHMEAAVTNQMPSWMYTRIANPTLTYLEETLALLEGYGYAGETSAYVTASGMAAIWQATSPFLLPEVSNGQAAPMNIVVSPRCYGGTFMLFTDHYVAERGMELRWVREPYDLSAWEAQIDAHTRFVYGEMPSNPGLHVLDIAGLAEVAHRHGLPLIIDATVATPALLRPLCHGADIVVHSVSKTMTASGFGIAGAVVARHNLPSRVGPDELRANFAHYVKLLPGRDYGPTLSPFNALLTLNEVRTLRQRMDGLSRSAMQIATFLDSHPAIEAVAYPGLPNAEGHALAQRYCWLVDSEHDEGGPVNRYGHLLSFQLRNGAQAARTVLDRLALIWRATDLGRIKSVATIPAISTHQQQGDTGRALGGVPDTMIRLGVGAEHPADLIADLEQALAGA